MTFSPQYKFKEKKNLDLLILTFTLGLILMNKVRIQTYYNHFLELWIPKIQTKKFLIFNLYYLFKEVEKWLNLKL